MNKKAIEKKALLVSSLTNLVTGLAGLVIYIVTDLNFLLLDSVFSVLAFISSVAAFFISKHSHRKTEQFPNGLYFLEPLYGVLKSIATLMLLLITLLETSATAYAYFVDGQGQVMETGPVLPYTITMVVLCFGLSIYNRQMNKKIGGISTMIEAESRGSFVDGLISLGIAIAMCLLYLIDVKSPLGFLHYTGDFFITVALVACSFKEPLTILIHSFKEFARSTVQNDDIKEAVFAVFDRQLPAHQDELDILIFKQGMYIKVKVHITSVVDPHFVEILAEKKAELLNELRQTFDHLELEFSF